VRAPSPAEFRGGRDARRTAGETPALRNTRTPALRMKRICVIGCGAIGSLYAAHLARVAEVWAFVRREEHARALSREGLRVSGAHDFHVFLKATARPDELPDCELGIVATKATQVEDSIAPAGHRFNQGGIISAQNGLGSEEIIAKHTRGWVIRGTTFMSGTRHSDTHVQYELDAATWLGPYEPGRTPYALVKEAAELIVAGGLKADALEDARPAQWSKLIFNASVNGVSALTGLPHSPHFADESQFSDLGHVLHDLMNEGKRVAEAVGVELHEDPWEMNKIGALTNHPPSMLYDIRHQLPTEVDFLSGAIAREARRVGVPAPMHTAVYRLIKGRELSWAFEDENRAVPAHGKVH
jgi:2-dehydropantoate 2-reductase